MLIAGVMMEFLVFVLQAALFLGAVALLLAVGRRFKSGPLIVKATARRQVMPASIVRQREFPELTVKALSETFNLSSEERDELHDEINAGIDSSILSPLEAELRNLNYVIEVRIRNKQVKKRISNASLSAPDVRYYALQKNGSWNCGWNKGKVKLGDFHPREEARLYLWGGSVDDEGMKDAVAKVQVVHDDGIATVQQHIFF